MSEELKLKAFDEDGLTIISSLCQDSIIKENKLRVNFSKDLIVDRTNAFNYPGFKTFKKEISLLNPQKKLNSIFSKRLKI